MVVVARGPDSTKISVEPPLGELFVSPLYRAVMVSTVTGPVMVGLHVTEQLAWKGVRGPSVQLGAGLNVPGAEAVKSTMPVGRLGPGDVPVTVAVHTVWSIIPVPGPKIVGLQLTVVLVGGCA